MGFFSPAIDWHQMFYPQTPLLEIVVRGSVIYMVLFFMLRFVAKRETGTIGITDLLVLVLIADAAQNAMAGEYQSITDGVLLVAVILGWSILLNYLGFKFRRAEKFIKPPKLLLIKDGQFRQDTMRKEMVTQEELLTAVRQQGVGDVAKVSRAYAEPDGTISVITHDHAGHGRKRRKRKV